MIRFEIVGGSDCPQFGAVSHAVLIRGGVLQDADPLPVFSLAQMKRSIEEGKTWADMVGRSEHFFLLVPNWCVEEITSKFGDCLRLCPEVAPVPDKEEVSEELSGITTALIGTLCKYAGKINCHERGSVTLKWEPGKDIHIEVTGRYKESA